MDPSNAVVHLTMRHDKATLAVGTGVLYQKNGKTYIVTAWHNVTGRHSETLKPLNKDSAIPNNLIAHISVHMQSQDGSYNGSQRFSYTIPLEDDSDTFYLVHPKGWPRIDVAAIPIDPNRNYDLEGTLATGEEISIPFSMQNSSSLGMSFNITGMQKYETLINGIDLGSTLSVSDELFILGYPKGITDMYANPLWKRATVATHPSLGWERQSKFLVDCASRNGMSGAPVVFYNNKNHIQIGGMKYITSGPVTYFHGIYVNRLGIVDDFEAQIGTVWKRNVIDEILDQGIDGPHSTCIEAPNSEIDQAICELWPDSPDYASLILGGGCLKHSFTFQVMERLNGRADPGEVLKDVLRVASEKQ